MDLKAELIALMRREGASLVGVASVERFDGAPRGHHPRELLPSSQAVVSLGLKLPSQLVDWEGLLSDSAVIPEEARWEVESNHWYGRCCYEAMNIRLEQLGLRLTLALEEAGHEAMFFPATYAHHAPIMQKIPGYFAPFSHRHAAVRAGLGEFGYSNLVITPQFGPRVRFMSVLTSAPLEADPLLTERVCLGGECLACVDACGVPAKGLCAISPVAARDGGVWLDMPSTIDKPGCYTKYDGQARCWGKCIAACPVGR